MAHADYDCCAICDSKMGYSGQAASTKELVCGYCITSMLQQGVRIDSAQGLIDWIKSVVIQYAIQVLREAQFRRCYYGNDVDTELEARGAEFNADRTLKEYSEPHTGKE